MTCPRCGRSSPPPAGPFCPHCGAQVAVLHWVAEPPSSARTAPRPPRPRYSGPPRYALPPRWGFPPLPWRAEGPEQPPRTGPDQVVASLAVVLVPMLWAAAAVAGAAAAAEVWRYTLLLASRDRALSAGVVAASDALVASAGILAPTLAVLAGILMVTWTIRAAEAAAEAAGVRPVRSARAIVAGWLVPGLNLTVPGSVLAEIEHTALRLPVDRQPRPSRLVRLWWLLWAGGALLAVVVVLWSLRDGVQARADGVVLHALLDLLAAVTAGVTAVLVARLTRLVGPVRATAREIVVRIPAPAAPENRAAGPAPDTGDRPATPSPGAPAVHA